MNGYPIGQRCIIIGAWTRPALNGRLCTVESETLYHDSDPSEPGCWIDIDGTPPAPGYIAWWAPYRCLIPVGDDPDHVEQSEDKREPVHEIA